MSFTDGSSERTLKSNGVLLDRVDSVLWDGGFTVNQGRGDVYFFPFNRGLMSDRNF